MMGHLGALRDDPTGGSATGAVGAAAVRGRTGCTSQKSLAQQHFPRSACVLNRRVIATIAQLVHRDQQQGATPLR